MCRETNASAHRTLPPLPNPLLVTRSRHELVATLSSAAAMGQMFRNGPGKCLDHLCSMAAAEQSPVVAAPQDVDMYENKLFQSGKKDSIADDLAQKSKGRLHLKATLKPCKPVCLEWKDLSVEVDVEIDGSEQPGLCASKPTEKRRILNRLEGRAVSCATLLLPNSPRAGGKIGSVLCMHPP